MHPAPSVIIFTTLSGLGFGMLVWLGLGLPAVTGWVAALEHPADAGAAGLHIARRRRAPGGRDPHRADPSAAGRPRADLWWARGDGALARSGTDMASATGWAASGSVSAFEPPHTGPNYLLREMVHQVGRKHALKLRAIALLSAMPCPWRSCCCRFRIFWRSRRCSCMWPGSPPRAGSSLPRLSTWSGSITARAKACRSRTGTAFERLEHALRSQSAASRHSPPSGSSRRAQNRFQRTRTAQ